MRDTSVHFRAKVERTQHSLPSFCLVGGVLLPVRCWCPVISGEKFIIFRVDLIGQFSKTLTGVWTKIN